LAAVAAATSCMKEGRKAVVALLGVLINPSHLQKPRELAQTEADVFAATLQMAGKTAED
jgi:hypothetical protein